MTAFLSEQVSIALTRLPVPGTYERNHEKLLSHNVSRVQLQKENFQLYLPGITILFEVGNLSSVFVPIKCTFVSFRYVAAFIILG